MLQLDPQSKIILYPKPVNLHKSFDALMLLVDTEMNLKLEPNLYILFCNLRKNRIKILYYNGKRLLLIATRFEHALHFSFQEGVSFDSISFDKFLDKPNPRSRINKMIN